MGRYGMINQDTARQHDEIQLPEALERQLRRFTRRLFCVETFLALCGVACLALLSYGVLLYVDRFVDAPVWLRVLLISSAMLGWVCFGLHWLHNWCWPRRDLRTLARLAQRHMTGMGDRLLGAVELASGHRTEASMSTALCRAALAQVAKEATRHDFVRAVPLRRARLAGGALLLLVLLVLLPAIIFPLAGRNTLARWVRPLASIERYTFVQLAELPPQLHVAHGAPFVVTSRVLPGSRWIPSFASGRLQGQGRIRASLQDNVADMHLQGLTQEADLQIRIGDATLQTRVIPMHRPELLQVTAVEMLPGYLQREPLVTPLGSGRPSFLAGSTVTLTGTVSRALQEADVYVSESSSLPVQSNSFVYAGIEAETLLDEHVFTWRDVYGLEGASPYVLRADLHADQAPRVEMRGVERVITMLDDEVLTFRVRADDDYGVQETWVEWSGVTGSQHETPLPDGRHMVATGAPDRVTLEASFPFSAIALGIPEDSVVRLQAYAIDYLPGREPSVSVEHEIHILNRVEHADALRTRMDAVHARIESLTREEERLLEVSRDLATLPAEQLASDATSAQLRDSRQAELDNAAEAMDVAGEARQLLDEALRNDTIDAEALHTWSELVERLTSLAQGDMPMTAQALDQAAAQSDERTPALESAMQLQEQVLEELRRLEQLANQTVENMLARNFVNRLRQVAANERQIHDRMIHHLPEFVGLAPDALSDMQREEIEALAALQEQARYEAGTIQDDLPGFFSRTRQGAYFEVFEQMQEKQTMDGLAALHEKIAYNRMFMAIGVAADWEGQFLAWADLLRDAQDSDGDGDGEGEEEEWSDADIEVIFGLLRARQREETLREQTRMASQTADEERHARVAQRLADIQEDIAAGLRELDGTAEHPGLQELLLAVIGEMDEATALLNRPRADADVIAIQTVIIEMLSGSDDGDGEGGAGMQMMQAILGSMPGSGLMEGGPGPQTADEPGWVDGTDPDDRGVERAGGTVAQDWPVEYRDALQEFYNIMDGAQ